MDGPLLAGSLWCYIISHWQKATIECLFPNLFSNFLPLYEVPIASSTGIQYLWEEWQKCIAGNNYRMPRERVFGISGFISGTNRKQNSHSFKTPVSWISKILDI